MSFFPLFRWQDQEKKLKKKGGAVETEESEDAVDSEKPERTPEAPPSVQVVPKEKKEKTIKARRQTKAPDSVPKAILKRRKSNNYWVWAAGSAALAVFLCVILAFYSLR
ncbi:hypothetical protein MLD38_035197 [Melastoma candidum]|uniref:Uncharacterized protein n=1 Tax=Melastoma candidum TaxID=119954 RepID=A0ACB9ME00_9MYRT|nr:hypothetical protein MLD38_035197 [Melastoma candidum]